jgi:hypothetical protein
MKTVVGFLGVMLAGVYLCAQDRAQAPAAGTAAGADAAGNESLNRAGGLPPRATAGDYQLRIPVGKMTLAAEFMGHGVPTLEGGPYTTEDYLIVEVALFGAPGAKLAVSYQDFSLRVNGKKMAVPAVPYLEVFRSLKDPDWEPANKDDGGKTSFNTGAGNTSDPPRLEHMPIERQRAMQQRVMKVSLGEGDRPLPQAGLLFFEYHALVDKIHSMELIYNGPAGKATLALQK